MILFKRTIICTPKNDTRDHIASVITRILHNRCTQSLTHKPKHLLILPLVHVQVFPPDISVSSCDQWSQTYPTPACRSSSTSPELVAWETKRRWEGVTAGKHSNTVGSQVGGLWTWIIENSDVVVWGRFRPMCIWLGEACVIGQDWLQGVLSQGVDLQCGSSLSQGLLLDLSPR